MTGFRVKNVISVFFALLLALAFATAAKPAMAANEQDGLPQWYGLFYKTASSGEDNLRLEGISTSLNGVVNVTFTGNGESFDYTGASDGTTLLVPFPSLAVGRYEVQIADQNDPPTQTQVVGHYTVMTPFDAYNSTHISDPAILGAPVEITVLLPYTASGQGYFGEYYQQGTEAKFILPSNVVAFDPETGEEVEGEIIVPLIYGGETQGYYASIEVKGYSGDSAIVPVEILKNGVSVGTPMTSAMTEPANMPLDLYFINGPVSAEKSTMMVIDGTNPKFANGLAAHTIQVETKNAYGVTIPGTNDEVANLLVTSSPAENVTIGQLQETDNSGIYQASITSTSVGSKTIAVTSGGDAIPTAANQTNQAIFSAGPAVASNSTMTASEGNRVANGKDTHEVTITARDSENRPVEGATVSITGDAKLTAGNSGPYITNSEGQVTVTFTSETVGSFPVSATIDGDAVEGSPQTLTFIATSPTPSPSETTSHKNGQSSLAKTGPSVTPLQAITALLLLVGTGIVAARRRA